MNDRCNVRWCDENGQNWHSCCLPLGHEGSHENMMGRRPQLTNRLYVFGPDGLKAGTADRTGPGDIAEDKFARPRDILGK